MVKNLVLVENLCKTMRKSMGKKCVQKSGKEFYPQNLVENQSFQQSFSTSLHNVLNNDFISVKCGLFHIFHIAYYYNY